MGLSSAWFPWNFNKGSHANRHFFVSPFLLASAPSALLQELWMFADSAMQRLGCSMGMRSHPGR